MASFAAASAPAARVLDVRGRRGVISYRGVGASRVGVRCRAVEEPKPVSISAPEGFVAPEPRKFTVAEGSLGRVASSAIPLVLRAGTGALINGWSPSLAEDDGEGYALFRVAGKKFAEASDLGPRPAHPIELFEYEGSPYCRKVREAAAVLDLDVLFRPCPSGETHWRPMAKAEGAATFPYLKDPNTGVSMIESDDIVEYLFRTYGPVANRSEAPAPNASPEELGVPFMLRRGGITNPTCYAAAVARLKALGDRAAVSRRRRRRGRAPPRDPSCCGRTRRVHSPRLCANR